MSAVFVFVFVVVVLDVKALIFLEKPTAPSTMAAAVNEDSKMSCLLSLIWPEPSSSKAVVKEGKRIMLVSVAKKGKMKTIKLVPLSKADYLRLWPLWPHLLIEEDHAHRDNLRCCLQYLSRSSQHRLSPCWPIFVIFFGLWSLSRNDPVCPSSVFSVLCRR